MEQRADDRCDLVDGTLVHCATMTGVAAHTRLVGAFCELLAENKLDENVCRRPVRLDREHV